MSGLAIVAEAKKQLKNPISNDPFNFVIDIYRKAAGIDYLKRGYSYFLAVGIKVSIKDIQLGDVIIKTNPYDLGIYIGNNKMILAPNYNRNPMIIEIPKDHFEIRRYVKK